jgi:hypothetical protein
MRLLLNRRAMRGAPMTTLIPGAERVGDGLSDSSAGRTGSGQRRH